MITDCMEQTSVANRPKNTLKCDICPFKAPTLNILNDHVSCNHSFQCEHCSITFVGKDNYAKHLSQCHPFNFYVCGKKFCSFQCSDEKTFQEHRITHSSLVGVTVRVNQKKVKQTNQTNEEVNIASENDSEHQQIDYNMDESCLSSDRNERNSTESVSNESKIMEITDSSKTVDICIKSEPIDSVCDDIIGQSQEDNSNVFPQIESSQHSVKEENEEQFQKGEPMTDIETNDSVLSGTSESESNDNRRVVSNHTNKVTQKRKNRKIDDNIRQLIIRFLNNGMKPKDVAEMFGQKPNTITKIYSVYKKTGKQTKSLSGHRNQKLNEEQKRQICVWVDQNCKLSLKELQTKCFDEWPELGSISTSTIKKALKAFHFTFIKRIANVPEIRNTPEVIDRRYEYAVQYKRLKSEDKKFYFIDKFDIEVCSRASGGGPIGAQKASKELSRLRTRHYTVSAVMATDYLYSYEIEDRSGNGEHYLDFVNQLCDSLAADGITDAYLVLDLKFNNTRDVEALIESRGHNLLYLPPYSPFLDPIEDLFNEWKGIVKRKEPTNEQQLYKAVHSSSQEISSEQCRYFITNMERYLNLSLHKVMIIS